MHVILKVNFRSIMKAFFKKQATILSCLWIYSLVYYAHVHVYNIVHVTFSLSWSHLLTYLDVPVHLVSFMKIVQSLQSTNTHITN